MDDLLPSTDGEHDMEQDVEQASSPGRMGGKGRFMALALAVFGVVACTCALVGQFKSEQSELFLANATHRFTAADVANAESKDTECGVSCASNGHDICACILKPPCPHAVTKCSASHCVAAVQSGAPAAFGAAVCRMCVDCAR